MVKVILLQMVEEKPHKTRIANLKNQTVAFGWYLFTWSEMMCVTDVPEMKV